MINLNSQIASILITQKIGKSKGAAYYQLKSIIDLRIIKSAN